MFAQLSLQLGCASHIQLHPKPRAKCHSLPLLRADLRPRPENEASGSTGFGGAIGVSIPKIQLKVRHMVMFHAFCKRKEWSNEGRVGVE